MLYISKEFYLHAKQNLKKNLYKPDTFAGFILFILNSEDRILIENKSFKVNMGLFSNMAEQAFYFGDPSLNKNKNTIWLGKLEKNWAEKLLNKFLKNKKINFNDLLVTLFWWSSRQQMKDYADIIKEKIGNDNFNCLFLDDDISEEKFLTYVISRSELLHYYKPDVAIKKGELDRELNKIQQLLIKDPNDKKNELQEKEIKKKLSELTLTFKIDGTFIKKNPTELSGATFSQTLYAANDIKNILNVNTSVAELVENVYTISSKYDLNRILFGAAGTGKTFHSINHALSIIENEQLEVLEQEDRTALKTRFDQYKEQGQIKFVTFHQSFSYEDFVEGIRAETNDVGQLTYEVKPGVFKEICDIAFNQNLPHSNIDEVITNFCKQIAEQPLQLKTKTGLTYEITYEGGKTLKCFLLDSVNKGTYSLSLDTIKKLLNGVKLETYGMPSYIKPIVSLLSKKIKFSEEKKYIEHKPYILIIDEINRGNISRIFGELITLIEESKRQGAEEELSVTLPYSKEEFSVPNNVYIIGTMNSSDRSLTGLDIALRRRFTFIEMPPKPELLNEIEVEGLNIGELLKVINQRIEVLLDRDHCIGHANFMSLKNRSTLENLASIFKQKIIPQLQEYFFDDWSKINMVLNDNGMLKAKPIEHSALFPNVESDSDGFFEEQKIWQLNDTAFDSIASFSKIIKH